jgi:hypothetical protein
MYDLSLVSRVPDRRKMVIDFFSELTWSLMYHYSLAGRHLILKINYDIMKYLPTQINMVHAFMFQ